MKQINVFNRNIDLQAPISNYESLMFTRSWWGIGDLEMRINRYKNYTNTLQKGNIIVVSDESKESLKNKAYIIRHKEIELDENGKATENYLIKALELKSITGQRITFPPPNTGYDNKSGNSETVMKHYINNHLVNPIDARRKIEQLIIATNQNRGSNISWRSRLKDVSEEMNSIALLTGLGWNVAVDYELKKYAFDVQEGRNLSVNQTVNDPVIFSPAFDNVKTMHFSDSDLNYKNMAYVAGQGEGVERRIIGLGGSIAGLDRHEIFVDARDVPEETDTDPPEQRPESEIIADLTTRGNETLSQLDTELFLEAQIMTPVTWEEITKEHYFLQPSQVTEKTEKKVIYQSTFNYEEDWDLGDIVTVQNKGWGITSDTRITEVTEIYEPSGFKLEVTFGNKRPTLIDKIKQQFEQVSPELRR